MKIELNERERLITLAALMRFEEEIEKDPGWMGFYVSGLGGPVINGKVTVPQASLDEVKKLTERYWDSSQRNSKERTDSTEPVSPEAIPLTQDEVVHGDRDSDQAPKREEAFEQVTSAENEPLAEAHSGSLQSPTISLPIEGLRIKPDLFKEFFEDYDDWSGDLDALRLNMSIAGHVGNAPCESAENYAHILLNAQNQRAWVERFTNLSYDIATKIYNGTLSKPSSDDLRQVFRLKLAHLLIELSNDPAPTGPFARNVCEVLIMIALEHGNTHDGGLISYLRRLIA